MKKVFSILLVVILLGAVAFCAVACDKDETPAVTEFIKETTLDKEADLLFGQDKAFAIMDKVVNFSVEYSANGGNNKQAGIAKLVLDTTNDENFVSIYANSSLLEEGLVTSSSIEYMFLQWEEDRGELEKTLVIADSYKDSTGENIGPRWKTYSEAELESSAGANVKAYHQALIANCGAHFGTRYIREDVYDMNDDSYDTIKVTQKEVFSDAEMTKLVRTEITITYSYLNDEEKTINGTATIVLNEREIDLIDGTFVTAMTISSITIVEDGGFNLTATYNYDVYSLDIPEEGDFTSEWAEAYPLA